jgi:transposase, IS30 family
MAHHLTLEERGILYRLYQECRPMPEIAAILGRHRSTIYREVERNRVNECYRPQQAQELADQRRRTGRRPRKLEDAELHRYVAERLEKRWSPDQIAGRSRRDFSRRRSWHLSRQAIYNWIDARAPDWRRWLRRGGRRLPEKRGKLVDGVCIDGRPKVINHRRRYGDWEGDTVVSKGRRSGLITLVERKSGYARIGRVNNRKASTARHTIEGRLKDLPAPLCRSVTFDNGKEFAEHARLARTLDLQVYFAQPYRAWQRGTNENTNGLLRQFFPKDTDFSRISHHAVARVEALLNERPRKRLGYRTPVEILSKRFGVAIDA